MKILFVDTVHPFLEEALKKSGHEIEFYNDNSREGLLKIIHFYEGIVIRSKVKLDEEILKIATNLKFIARAGAGMENIDVEYANNAGIKLYNAPEGNRDAVGEHALGMLLMLMHHLKRADMQVRNGIWKREENRGTEIMGKTIGLIGFGNTGSQFAKKLSGFEATILAYDKYKSGFSNEYVKESTMDEIFKNADIVSFHIPLTEETHYLFDEQYINSFQKPFYFINTSRGKNVNTSHLVQGLKSGKVLGACLDVIEYESVSFENVIFDSLPDSYQYLIHSENVILAPHIAGWTHESHKKMSVFLAEKILQDFPG